MKLTMLITPSYIFTSLAHAGDLFSYCTSHGGKLDDLEGRVICRQVVLALSYIHEKGIAHRDIKMENVLVMKTYDFSCRIVLTDFGFAIRVDQKTGRMNSRVGTEGYVAPYEYTSPLYSILTSLGRSKLLI
jgi:meiosis-specific serine/threonine-protein kinase MEK1